MISTTADYWIHSLKKVNHHEPLIQLIQLSQRIKLKIELLQQMSPTKTCYNGIIYILIKYYHYLLKSLFRKTIA
jgi:hypothetical protein